MNSSPYSATASAQDRWRLTSGIRSWVMGKWFHGGLRAATG